MTDPNRSRLDPFVWRTATRSLPLVIQGALAVELTVIWLLGKLSFVEYEPHHGQRGWTVLASLVTSVFWLAVAGVLWAGRTPRMRGLSLASACSALTILFGGTAYAAVMLW